MLFYVHVLGYVLHNRLCGYSLRKIVNVSLKKFKVKKEFGMHISVSGGGEGHVIFKNNKEN